MSRYRLLEEKTYKHLGVLALMLGAFTVSLPNAVDAWRLAPGILARVFSGFYIGLAASTFAGIFCALRAVKYEILYDHPVDVDGFFSRHTGKDYRSTLSELTDGAIDAFGKNRPARLRKEQWAMRVYWFLWAVFGFAVATIVSYVLIVVGA